MLLCMLMCASSICNAQKCHYTISGKVLDRQKQPVPGVIVRLVSGLSGAATDTAGRFSISGVCPGKDSIAFGAIGYNKVSFAINIDGNKVLDVTLSSSDNQLGDVVVNGEKMQELHTVSQAELKGLALEQVRGESLGEALKELPGVSAFQTGPTLFKPEIHGLYSNNILILNDGVTQEGQQWGSEHAPEIDPFTANSITVIKGAASVRYGSDAIGGVIVLNPAELPTETGIKGDFYMIGESNGNMGILSGKLEGMFGKKLKGLSWRIQGTARKAGTFRTPTYYLTNTGTQEGDFSADLGYTWKRLKLTVHYSEYNAEIGIFAGAEANSIQDLDSAFKSPKPLCPSFYSYNVSRSYQIVDHDLLKTTAEYTFNNNGKLELDFGLQKDLREEYSSDLPLTLNPAVLAMPQLTFQLNTQTLDLVYTQPGKNGFSGSCGFTGSASGNTVTGLFYLVPNFRSYNGGLFYIERYSVKKFTFEAGLRYDYRWLQVYMENQTTLVDSRATYTYPNNVSGSVGASYAFNSKLSLSTNVGSGWRAPSINEMYIYGVHFSDARFEVGDDSLHPQRSINTGLSLKYNTNKFRVSIDGYYNIINNYIYEEPEVGTYTYVYGVAYPTFQYTQSNVNIKGLDLVWSYDILKHLTFQSKTSIVRGYNESIHDYLIYMPSDRFQNELIYHFDKIGKLNNPYVSVENLSVLAQTRVPANSDYEPPPAAYSLFNAHAGFFLPVKKNRSFNFDVTVNNIGNVQYRDYLDQYRYFANELGVNCTLRIKYSF